MTDIITPDWVKDGVVYLLSTDETTGNVVPKIYDPGPGVEYVVALGAGAGGAADVDDVVQEAHGRAYGFGQAVPVDAVFLTGAVEIG